jgi:hypothetical protein
MRKRSAARPFRTAFIAALSAVVAALAVSGCWNPVDPEQGGGGGPEYYTFCDSAWKVIKNLEFAYQAKDLDHYLACFRSDFEFHLLEVDWDDYDGDGIIDEYWGRDLEEQFHESMFGFVDNIDLTFSGNAEWPWSGDSTGQSLELPRTFDLKVYYTIPGSPYEGSQASGQAIFICRTDTTTGEWYIWMWFDQSET